MLIKKAKSRLNVLKTAHLLGQEWDKILAGQNCISRCCPVPLLDSDVGPIWQAAFASGGFARPRCSE
jgi:hypothetical protein